MEARELMIGDWVVWSKNNIRIGCAIDLTFAKEFFPIPLTAEILKKNEFINYASASQWVYKSNIKFVLSGETFFRIIVCGNTIGVKYVHELQHILRFCGLNELAGNFKI